jgi:ABC-type multidrug transport system fused ATPase/permease subunit/GT2 family glycosyltransferase
VLAWQIRTAFSSGCAGAFAFSWTDEWFAGGIDVEDWKFGLVRRDRSPKPALSAVRKAFHQVPFSPNLHWPLISVVVCTYNGARVITDCLEGLKKLDYPRYEVIIVDDGSTDQTASLVKTYGFRLIRTENRGLSSARNTGLEAAQGEIIAYIDDDAYPDAHWLTYLAWTFLTTKHAAVGGPNIPPPDDGPIADCVANAPGGPVHVLLSDREAEHIPGCNMAFRKICLTAAGGFDPQFRVAGDDVDVCWRLQQQGWTLGFHPAAVVWHHRRNSVRAYWKQQSGYGRAEALLEKKWPEKYNAAGHVSWAGRMYGRGLVYMLGWGGRIYHGIWGSGLFQSLYEPVPGLLWSLPLMPEWYLIVAGLAFLSALEVLWAPLLYALPLLVLAAGAPCIYAAVSAARASFSDEAQSHARMFKLRSVTALLYVLQPLARLYGRLRHGLTLWRRRSPPGFQLPRPRTFTAWSEEWQLPADRLQRIEAHLKSLGAYVRRGGAFDYWDLEVQGGMLGSARMNIAVEDHDGGKQLIRVRSWPFVSRKGLLASLLFAGLSGMAWPAHARIPAAILGGVAVWLIVHALQGCAAATQALCRALDTKQGAVSGAAGVDKRHTRKHSDFGLYGRLLRQARPHWPHMMGLLLLTLFAGPLALLSPLALKILVDSVLSARPLPTFIDTLLPPTIPRSSTTMLLIAISLLLGTTLLNHIHGLISSLLRAYTSERLVLGFQARLFHHLQRLSLSYHDSKGTSDSLYRIQYDAPSIQYITIDGVIPFVGATLTLLMMIYVTARIDWQLAVVALAVLPGLFVVTRVYRGRLRRQSRKVKKLESSLLSVVQEVLSASRVVKAFGQERREQERFVRRSNESVRARIQLTLVEGTFGLLIGLITAVGTAAVFLIGTGHVQSGVLTLGELLMVVTYLAQVYEPLKTISKKTDSLQSYLASAERAFSLLDQPTEVPERIGARLLWRAEGAVAFRNVSFAYSNNEIPVLCDVAFDVVRGTRVGIVGMTGAGKSTLVNLLTRFYDPTAGQILLDGVDLRDYKLEDLRKQFGIVLQESILFSTTIADNIAYGRPHASEEEIIAAAKAANAHEFIVRLPEGYQTQVGERGLILSVGERQRIALARAFLKQAPILILDEPTSSVDAETEGAIMEAMERLMNGRTSFMIAHRTSTLANCDVLFRIEHGRLITIPRLGSATKAQQSNVAGDVSGSTETLSLQAQQATQNHLNEHATYSEAV